MIKMSDTQAARNKNAMSWEDFKMDLAKKHSKGHGSAALEAWENSHYEEQLGTQRDEKRRREEIETLNKLR